MLEAIVALTLLAGTGLALFSWLQQNLQTASRLREHEQQARLLATAQGLVDQVNPMRDPRGATELGDLEIQWQAALVEPVRRGAAFSAESNSAWRLGLYRLDVRARDKREGTQVRFEQWRVGTERVVPVQLDIDR